MAEIKEKSEQPKTPRRKMVFTDYVRLVLANWYWFVLSFVVCFCVAKHYLNTTPPKYQRTATMLVKDSRKGSSSDFTAFSDIMGGMGRRSVDNEVYIFRSRAVMEQVVKRFDLATQYTAKVGMRTADLYGRTPIVVSFLTEDPTLTGSFKCSLTKDGNIRLSGFKHSDFTAEVAPGSVVATPMGDILVTIDPKGEEFRNKDINVTRYTFNAATEKFRGQLKCEITDKQASIIALTFVDEVPQRAEDILNGIIDGYNEDAIRDKQLISDLTESFIKERLITLGEELNSADNEVASFKQDNRLYSPSNEVTMGAEELARLKKEALAMAADIEMAEYILNDIKNNHSALTLVPASIVAVSSVSNALATQIDTYNKGILEYSRLKTNSTQSPVVNDMESQLLLMRSNIILSMESYIEGLKLQSEAISREQYNADQRLEDSPNKEKELLAIMRQQKVKEELFIYLLTKLEENALTRATANSNARIIDRPYGGDNPISPRPMLVYVMAAIFGFIIPFAILYLLRILNTKVRSRREIEDVVSAPFIGTIPRFTGSKTANGIVVKEDSRDTASEAFRILRTNLNFMSIDNDIKVIMTTSSIPHSGKTFVSNNLAMTFAAAGKRTLLVDLDLRRRATTINLGHRKDRRGITSYLTGAINSINDIITRGELHPNLDIIYAGPHAPNPSEILMSKTLEDVINKLREQYDYIILDSVPAMAIADAQIIDRLVDHTIYIVRQGNLEYRHLFDIQRLYVEKKFHSMSILFNGVKRSPEHYRYDVEYRYDMNQPLLKRQWSKVKGLFKK